MLLLALLVLSRVWELYLVSVESKFEEKISSYAVSAKLLDMPTAALVDDGRENHCKPKKSDASKLRECKDLRDAAFGFAYCHCRADYQGFEYSFDPFFWTGISRTALMPPNTPKGMQYQLY